MFEKIQNKKAGGVVYKVSAETSRLLEMFFIVCDFKKRRTAWKLEKQFVNKLSLLRIILQRKENWRPVFHCSNDP